MENFTFYNPTKIEFGTNKEQLIGQHLAQFGVKKVLLCYGSERIKQDGLFTTITSQLNEHGIEFIEFGGIVSNPVLSKVREAIKLIKATPVEAILSVGGGSVLDSAKAIAAGAKHEGDVWDLFIGKAQIKSALPIFAMMTLAATGSEMNTTAVVTNQETKEKLFIADESLFPKVSIVNPELMQSVPKDYLVYSAADIIAHSIEGYFTATDQPHLQSRIVEAIINTVIETTEVLLSDSTNYNARAEFAWASTLALNGLTTAGTAGFNFPNHMIEHSLSALFNVPHGAGLSIIIPAWMKWHHSHNTDQFKRFAKQVFAVKTAEEGIVALENWFNKIGTPTRLSQLNITQKDLPLITDNVLNNAKIFGIYHIYTKEVVNTILQDAL
ncbi:iron-containing alcohol dehydrogenase [Entomomonas moraniae]|uniref:Iron-containing alcohol dehydrogenase n=1 Tax=Entomomonas moraniae TaxID=2213226 RepID=A0A3Q9JKW5_9GAMM|nr:iron-containing alcohol dehydrogenase [Entomomonas moraniae]AZS49879.1 iron-containing alcohol dehydrogenase [Entomomonas moraniae]